MSTARLAARFLLASHGLDPALEDQLESIIDGCFSMRAEPGDVICREGGPANDLYFLLEGRVQVRMRDYLGVEQDLAQLGAPTMFGHMGLIDGSPRSATCIALGEARINILDRDRYQGLVEDPGVRGDMFRRLMISAMNRQLSGGNQALRSLLAREPDEAHDARALGRISGTLEGWEQGD